MELVKDVVSGPAGFVGKDIVSSPVNVRNSAWGGVGVIYVELFWGGFVGVAFASAVWRFP
jgi:hypothetical protein